MIENKVCKRLLGKGLLDTDKDNVLVTLCIVEGLHLEKAMQRNIFKHLLFNYNFNGIEKL